MVQGLGVCIASFAIFITYIIFGLMSPRNMSKKVVLPPLGLLFCLIRYGLELMMLYGMFEGYMSKAIVHSILLLASFGITGVFYLQNAGFMNNPEVIGKKNYHCSLYCFGIGCSVYFQRLCCLCKKTGIPS